MAENCWWVNSISKALSCKELTPDSTPSFLTAQDDTRSARAPSLIITQAVKRLGSDFPGGWWIRINVKLELRASGALQLQPAGMPCIHQPPHCSIHSLTLVTGVHPFFLDFAVRKPKSEIGCLLIKQYLKTRKQSTAGKPEAAMSHLQRPRKLKPQFLLWNLFSTSWALSQEFRAASMHYCFRKERHTTPVSLWLSQSIKPGLRVRDANWTPAQPSTSTTQSSWAACYVVPFKARSPRPAPRRNQAACLVPLSLETIRKINFTRWNKRKSKTEIEQYLTDILLTVWLSWKAFLWLLRDFHDTQSGSSYILCNPQSCSFHRY